jgi:excisionase family DNA binding protein
MDRAAKRIDRGQAMNEQGPVTIIQIEPILVTKAVAADLIGFSTKTLEELVNAGELPVVRVGRAVRFRVTDLKAWADANAKRKGGNDAST